MKKPNPQMVLAAINKRDAAALKRLLAAGADPNGTLRDDYHGSIPLLVFSCRVQFTTAVEVLLAAGANPNAPQTGGEGARPGHAPLHAAIAGGPAVSGPNYGKGTYDDTKTITRLLLRGGADSNAVDQDDRLPLYYAARSGYLEVCRLLVDCGAAFKVWPKGCIPPLVGASEGSEPEHTAIAAWLLGLGAPVDGETATGRTALMRASTSNNPELVELLLSRGADVNHHSKEGLTPLLCCVANAKWLRSRDATEKALRIAKALAVAGADLGIRCEPQSGIPVGGTALEIAETAEDPTMANYLRGVTSAALPRRAS